MGTFLRRSWCSVYFYAPSCSPRCPPPRSPLPLVLGRGVCEPGPRQQSNHKHFRNPRKVEPHPALALSIVHCGQGSRADSSRQRGRDPRAPCSRHVARGSRWRQGRGVTPSVSRQAPVTPVKGRPRVKRTFTPPRAPTLSVILKRLVPPEIAQSSFSKARCQSMREYRLVFVSLVQIQTPESRFPAYSSV